MTNKQYPNAKVENLYRKFREAKEELAEALREAYPVKVGDIVTSEGADYRVCEVWTCEYLASVVVDGNRRRKNGSFSRVARPLDTWKLKEAVSPTPPHAGVVKLDAAGGGFVPSATGLLPGRSHEPAEVTELPASANT
jgi:hypothetical protein